MLICLAEICSVCDADFASSYSGLISSYTYSVHTRVFWYVNVVFGDCQCDMCADFLEAFCLPHWIDTIPETL